MSHARRPSNQNRPGVDREGPVGLRFGMFATCVIRDGSEDISGRPKELYILLVTYADTGDRDTNKGYPYRTALAAALGCSPKTVDRATAKLEEIGLLSVKRRKLPGSQENDANRYKLHDGWLIHGAEPSKNVPRQLVARYGDQIPGFDVAAFLEGGDTGDATPRDTGDATGGDMGVPLSRAGSPEPSSRDGAAPAARRADDARRASTGSRGLADGGSAASGNNTSPLTPAQGKAIAAAVRALPEELRALLPTKRPRNLSLAILDALASGTPADRTPEQLVAYRVAPKWWKHYAALHDAGRLDSAVGALIRMLARDQECGNLRCDERVDVDTGQPCRFCATAKADRSAARKGAQDERRETAGDVESVPKQRADPLQCCDGCERGFRAPEPGLCRDCSEPAHA